MARPIVDEPKKKTARAGHPDLHVYIRPDLRHRLRVFAAGRDASLSEVVTAALEEYLARHEGGG